MILFTERQLFTDFHKCTRGPFDRCQTAYCTTKRVQSPGSSESPSTAWRAVCRSCRTRATAAWRSTCDPSAVCGTVSMSILGNHVITYLFESGPLRCIVIVTSPRPLSGARSVPVTKARNFFLFSSLSPRTTCHKWRITGLCGS